MPNLGVGQRGVGERYAFCILPVVSIKLQVKLGLDFSFRSAVLQSDIVVIVKKRFEMLNEFIQSNSCTKKRVSFITN